LSLVLISAVPSDAPAQSGGTLVIALDQEPPTLDPHASPSAVTYQIIGSVTENLLYRGPDGKLAPWLAESWQSAKDGKSVTFKLRRDVKFHDGTPFKRRGGEGELRSASSIRSSRRAGARAALTT
jgi:ABC-type transport system substrate-binding protein